MAYLRPGRRKIDKQKQEYKDLLEDIKTNGLTYPIVVNKDMWIIDGLARYYVLIELGKFTIDVIVADLYDIAVIVIDNKIIKTMDILSEDHLASYRAGFFAAMEALEKDNCHVITSKDLFFSAISAKLKKEIKQKLMEAGVQ